MYKALRDEPEFDVNAGAKVELDVTAEREAELLASGRFELVPRLYRVVGSNKVQETDPGETFEAALPLAREQMLITGGHIERVESIERVQGKKATTSKPGEKEE